MYLSRPYIIKLLTVIQVFLTRSTDRVITTDNLRPPNPNCNVCGITQTQLLIDPTRATLNDLVEDVLKNQLQYGEEFSVSSEAGTLYDPELDDNLSKTFADLGIKTDSFLTVIDDDDENPRVNLSLSISEKYTIIAELTRCILLMKRYRPLPADSKPVILPQRLEIARKLKVVEDSQPDGPLMNGLSKQAVNGNNAKRKRSPEDSVLDQEQLLKRKRDDTDSSINPVTSKKSKTKDDGNDAIVLDDSSGGAIVIDDD